MVLFFNKDVYFCLGDIIKDSDNFFLMIKVVWVSVLGIEYFEVKSSVYFLSNFIYYIYKGKDFY